MAVKKIAGPRRYFPKDKWKKKELKDHALIIGNSDFAVALAQKLSSDNKPVTVINTDVSAFSNYDDNPYLKTVQANPAELSVLKDSLYPTSRVLAVSENDADNIIAALLARKYFKLDNVYITLKDPELKILYEDQGITELTSDDVDEISALLFPQTEE